MVDISKIFRDKSSSAFFSFIIGLGIAVLLFHKPYGRSQYLSVPLSQIEGKPIKNGDKCYQYTSEDVKCS